jgi:hypothetical protein
MSRGKETDRPSPDYDRQRRQIVGDLLSRDETGARSSELHVSAASLTNGDLGELLVDAAREETDHRRGR